MKPKTKKNRIFSKLKFDFREKKYVKMCAFERLALISSVEKKHSMIDVKSSFDDDDDDRKTTTTFQCHWINNKKSFKFDIFFQKTHPPDHSKQKQN